MFYRYEWIFDNLKDLEITVPKVLSANLTDKEKEKAIVVLASHQPESIVYEETAKLIKRRRDNPIPLDQLLK